MERLGFGLDVLLGDNPTLVYGRLTGWGQDEPFAHKAGHDINYLAISSLFSTVDRAGTPPVPPVNSISDFGGDGEDSPAILRDLGYDDAAIDALREAGVAHIAESAPGYDVIDMLSAGQCGRGRKA
ncbi:MAG: CoA transferase [Sphingobium sp.]